MTNVAYDRDLDRNPANYQPLTPLLFLERAAQTHPLHAAVVHNGVKTDYRTLRDRCVRLASALAARGFGGGDTIAALLPNIPAMLESHYGVPMAGCVLNTINTRLDAETIAYILDHGEAQAIIVDREFWPVLREALTITKAKPLVLEVDDGVGAPIPDAIAYEDFVASGDPAFDWPMPKDEWDAISLNYTSGTTGRPKGVVYHHRGAYLLAMGNVLAADIRRHPVYLWTLPMFHCNGWCFPWTISAVAGTHVCLRAVRGPVMWKLMSENGVTLMCGAPVVMATLLDTPADQRAPLTQKVRFTTAGAPPPEAVLARMAVAGFEVCHVYGLTECYGPAVVNEWHRDWDDLPPHEQAGRMARQGVRYTVLEALDVKDPITFQSVPADGITMGEVMMRGNVVSKGYFKDAAATQKAFEHGWFHTGDLAVKHTDQTIQLRDRSKDIIISGGENISSIEIEDALYKHPAVALAAVVAQQDDKWGEVPCAFIELKPGMTATEAELIAWCRQHMASFKAPKRIVFSELPRTSTGKIQKHILRSTIKV